MKTVKMIKTGNLPLAAILFSMIFILQPELHGQDGKAKKGQPDVQIDVKREYDQNGNISRYDSSYSFSWSYDGLGDMDSLFESLRNNFGISPFPDNDFFNWTDRYHHFHMLPRHGQINPEADGDSLYEYINPRDSIYSFDEPFDFFYSPYHGYSFNDTLFNEFFHDPMFGLDPLYWPDFDMRGMMENHRKMMEEMHKFFEFDMPRHPLTPDSVPGNPLQQKNFAPSRPVPNSQEI